VVTSLPGHKIHVWVLIDDGRWMLQRTIDVQDLLPRCCREDTAA
jgi:hypothetical protein